MSYQVDCGEMLTCKAVKAFIWSHTVRSWFNQSEHLYSVLTQINRRQTEMVGAAQKMK